MIEHTPAGYFVKNEDGKKKPGGPYTTEEEAKRRLVTYLAKRTAFPDTDFDTLTRE